MIEWPNTSQSPFIENLAMTGWGGCLTSPGGRKVSEPIAEVSRSHIRMHDGLVRAVAEGRPRCRLEPLPHQLRDRLLAAGQTGHRPDDGRLPGELRRYATYLFICVFEIFYVNHNYLVVSGFRSKCQKFCFCLAVTNFLFIFPHFPPLLNGWANGSRKRLHIIIKFQRTFNPVTKGQYTFIFSPKIVLPFPPFPGGVENTCS